MQMKVCVIGTGYVGLVTGVCLAEIGHDVICVDNDNLKIEKLRNGIIPIYEPGLDELVKRNLENKNLSFTTDISVAIKSQDIIFICVGTPPRPDGSADLQYVEEVAKQIGINLNDYKIVVNKSTVPIGSGDWVSMIINDSIKTNSNLDKNNNKNNNNNSISSNINDHKFNLNKGNLNNSINKNNLSKKFDVVSNPEFLREGSAILDTFFPDRIVLGSSSKDAIDIMKKLYAPIINQTFNLPEKIYKVANINSSDNINFDNHFHNNPHNNLDNNLDNKNFDKNFKVIPVVETDLVSAEMIKYAANSFLATKISFINEIANICEKAGADITKVAYGIGLDSRIGPKFLNAGIGWGGSCFPKDVSALTKIAAEYGISTQLLNAVINVNTGQRHKVVQKVQEVLKIVKGKYIGVLGVAFKPNTDDTRDAPSITIMNNLINLGAKIKAYDPIVKIVPESLNPKAVFCASVEEVFEGSDLVILTTEWEEFKKLDFQSLGSIMREKNIIDGRNFLDKEKLLSMGYNYLGIGR